MQQFLERFNFDKRKALWIGVERECFLADKAGVIVPIAEQVLRRLADPVRFTHELSACQLEERSGPAPVDQIFYRLIENDEKLKIVERAMNVQRLHLEVGPDTMPYDLYNDRDGRYRQLAVKMQPEVLRAACRVAGTHVHVGMPDAMSALRVYNKVRLELPVLIEAGDGSNGERMRLYWMVAPNCDPPAYESWSHFSFTAAHNGFWNDPRRCWTLIRISVHGTIEFRMFGATCYIDKVMEWVKLCHRLCEEAL